MAEPKHPTMGTLTKMLQAGGEGSPEQTDAALRRAWPALHRLASRRLRAERPDHTLQPTALVAEFYLRLRGGKQPDIRSREDFMRFADRVMRNVLIDHARGKRRLKRTPDEPLDVGPTNASALALEDGAIFIQQLLEELAELDPVQAEIVHQHVLVGLTLSEVPARVGCSERTVYRKWRLARAWLSSRLAPARAHEASPD